MEWSGKITTCDRCGTEFRRTFISEKEMDGGFTVNKNFEPLPEDWHYVSEIGWLCPNCMKKYLVFIRTFMSGGQ